MNIPNDLIFPTIARPGSGIFAQGLSSDHSGRWPGVHGPLARVICFFISAGSMRLFSSERSPMAFGNWRFDGLSRISIDEFCKPPIVSSSGVIGGGRDRLGPQKFLVAGRSFYSVALWLVAQPGFEDGVRGF